MSKRIAGLVFLALAVLAVPAVQAKDASARTSAAQAFHVTVTGHGTPMILIPGLSSSGEVWDSTVAHYRDRYQCHVLTLAGFAGQPPIATPLLATVREQLADYIRERRLDHPILVGHSLGGFLALWLAAEHPDLVGRVVVLDALPALGAVMNPVISAQDMEVNAARMRDTMLNSPEAQRVQYLKTSIEMMATAKADTDRIYEWATRSDGKTVADATYDMYTTDLRAKTARITAPTLVLGTWVAYEQYSTQAQTRANFEAQYKNLRGVRIELAPTARHFMMYDQPDWMFSQMDGFLAKSPAR